MWGTLCWQACLLQHQPPHRQSRLSSCPYIVVISPSTEPTLHTRCHLSDGEQERGASASACARACGRCIPWPTRPSARSPWACFLSADLKTKPRGRGSLLFGEASEKPLTYAPVLLHAPMRPTPLVAPRKFSQTCGPASASALPRPTRTLKPLWMGSPPLPISPPKVSDSSREIRIVAAPAHLLPPQKLPVSSAAQQKDHPACRPACPGAAVCYFLRSQRPLGLLFMRRGRRRDIQAKMGC